ncbi:SpaA isopeptide-forming pilin-related protein [Pseudobutyrivibrio sp.]|uniref:SpaA isopeptide-forming pilin-related protein n=1 Tax=Pseudobutyrivibrio sp. TaxID=2014367 RepID=UPI001D4B27A9|nr:SpaA isopeptide-forming pilin-related protein [Pseudobutyrivibrio sp.]MBE5911498.1 fibro-slime domain-containing protein [Pseudobutyrivibrio sp.]
MKRIALANRILSLGLAVALAASSPMSVYAGEETDAPVEASVQISEGAASSDVTSSDGSNSSESGQPESGDALIDASQTADTQTDGNGVVNTIADEIKNDIANEGTPAADTPVVDADEKASDDEAGETPAEDGEKVTDEETKPEDAEPTSEEEDAEKCEHVFGEWTSNEDGTHSRTCSECSEVETETCDYDEDGVCKICGYKKAEEDPEIEYTYTSNGDGTHTKTWVTIDEEGNEVNHEEIEECEFDENGICIHCGQEQSISLTDSNGIVRITGKKSVFGDAVSVSVEEITKESDEDVYNQMSEALDVETGEETAVVDFVAYDINLLTESGDVVEPNGEVKVEFLSLGNVEGIDDDSMTTEVYHYVDESVNKVETATDTTENEDADMEMITDHFSTYIVAVSGDLDAIYTSKYASIFSWYWSNSSRKYKEQDWDEVDSLPSVNKYYDWYYINNDDDTYYPLVVKIYVNETLVEESGYVCTSNTRHADQWFRVEEIAEGYSIDRFKAGFGDDLEEITADKDGDYEYTLENYCCKGNYNNQNPSINYIELYLSGSGADRPQFTVDLFKYNDTDTIKVGNKTLTAINAVAYSANSAKYLTMCSGSDSEDWNKCHENNANDGKAYQGMVSQNLGSQDGMITFNGYGTPGYFTTENKSSNTEYETYTYKYGNTNTWHTKAYYNVGFPFELDSDGYYVFNSANSKATFDSESGLITTDGDYGLAGFWPFGTYLNSKNEEKGYGHFGMHFTQEFNMTKTGTNNGEPCVFEFSGDDDVWVYVDGKLVLDMGGIHGVVKGSIDFSTGDCTVSNIYNSQASLYGTSFNMYDKGIFDKTNILDNGKHTLQVYYLERGLGKSNCYIKFNMPVVDETAPPVDPLEFTKVDANDTSIPVAGAKFTLVSSDGAYTALDADQKDVATSGSDGVVSFKYLKDANGNITEGIPQGLYILTETGTPSGYLSPTEAWYINVQSDGKGGSTFSIEGKLSEKTDNGWIIKNEKNEAGDTVVTTDKTATVSDWESRVYEIDLGASATKTTEGSKQDIVLVLDVSGSMGDSVSTVGKTTIENASFLHGKTFYAQQDRNYYFYRYDGTKWQRLFNGWNDYDGDIPDSLTPLDFEVSRLDLMKIAADDFVSGLEGTDCRVAVVEFSDKSDSRKVLGLTKCTSDNVSTIKEKINGLSAEGATRIDTGLEVVINEVLVDDYRTDEYRNNVILFTDGVPTTNKTFHTGVASAAEKCAGALRAATNVKTDWQTYDGTSKSMYGCAANIFFIKYDDGSATTQMTNFANNVAGSSDNVHSVSNMSKVSEAFQEVMADIVVGATGTVVDVVDPRFELVYKNTDGTYKKYVDGDKVKATIKNASGQYEEVEGTISTENGVQKITWSNIYIGPKASGTNGFDSKFLVKAKDDFMGGNAITTNGPASGVTVEGNTTNFDMPTVNVKLLSFSLTDNETTILLNDTFDVSQLSSNDEIMNLLSGIQCYYTDSNNVKHEISGVFNSNSISINNGVISYSYPGTADAAEGTIAVTSGTKAGDGDNKTVGDNSYYYETSVTFTATPQATRLSSAWVAPDSTNQEVTTSTGSGKYYINVVDAGIYFDKISALDSSKLVGATYGIFTDDKCTTKIKEISSSDANKNYQSLLIDGLGVGTYYIKEVQAPEGFTLSDEIFTVTITRAEANTPSNYKLTVTSSGDSVTSEIIKNFSVLGDSVDKGYFFDAAGKAIASNTTSYLLNSDYLTNSSAEKVYTVIVGTTETKVWFNAIDKVAYTLPETGGRGIYVYTIGGVLLMLGASLMLYKNKKNQKNIK